MTHKTQPVSLRYTAGPWRISATRWRPIASIRAANSKAVAVFTWLMTDALGAEAVAANARLMASSPELLDALECCLANLERIERPDQEAQDAMRLARTAIAKAKG
jgi:hypothetical protein